MESTYDLDAVKNIFKRLNLTAVQLPTRFEAHSKNPPSISLQAQKAEDQSGFVNVILAVCTDKEPTPTEDADAYNIFSAVWSLTKTDREFESLFEGWDRSDISPDIFRGSAGSNQVLLQKEIGGFVLRIDAR